VHCSNGAEDADLGETDTGKSHNKCLQFLCKRRTNTLPSTFILQIVADRDVLPTVLPVQWAKNAWKVVTVKVVCVRTHLLPLLLQQIELFVRCLFLTFSNLSVSSFAVLFLLLQVLLHGPVPPQPPR
jgi:hypothetical protein